MIALNSGSSSDSPCLRTTRSSNQFFNLFHGGKPDSASMARFVVERCWETDQGVMARRLAMLESFDVSDRLWRLESPTWSWEGPATWRSRPIRLKALASSIAGSPVRVRSRAPATSAS